MYYIVLSVSVLLNIILSVYAIKAAKRLLIVDSNIEGIQDTFSSFRGHLEEIYESEMYYGDQSLKALIDHSNIVLDEVEKYDNMYAIELPEESPEEPEEESVLG